MKALLACVLVCLTLPALAGEHYVKVPYKNIDDLKKLTEQGFDIGGINREKKRVTLVVKDEQMAKTRGLRILSKQAVGRPDKLYKKPADIEKMLFDAEAAFPHLVKVESIGKSVENRDIWAVHITNFFFQSDTPKRSVIFDSMHHAREVMTPEVALDIVDYLTKNYTTDSKVAKWVNNYDIWVVPMVNPDGNNKVWNSSSMWRKNTRGGYGVDINRNYTHEWNSCNGSSGSQSSDTYRGPSAGSEPETQALMSLAARVRPMFNISYHSFSEIVIYPYGCSPKHLPEPDRAIYEGVGKELAKKLVRDSGNGSYDAGTSYELLYDVDGGSVDFMYASEKIMSFVVEVNSDNQGFQPSYTTWRDKTVEKQRAGWQYILDRMEGPGIKP